MKTARNKSSKLLVVGLCLLSVVTASQLNAAVWYWDPNGLSSPTSGTWDTTSSQWATTSAATATPSVWNPANAAGFVPSGFGNINALTITVNQSIGFGGIFNGLNANAGVTNLTFIGTGSLNLNSGAQGFWTGQSYYNTIIQVPITGSGGVQNQSSGSLYLSANNTYSGGTFLATSAGLNFNNDNSFGTGFITNNVATTVLATPATDSAGNAFATSAITLANPVKTFGGNGTLILVGSSSAPVTFSGNWTLSGAAGTTATFDQRSSTTTVSGDISGAQAFAKTGNGTLILGGNNTYSGQTIVRNGILSVSSLNNVTGGSANSSLGHPITVANGTIALGATTTAGVLIYTGAGETSDRVINLAGTTGGATLQSDGTGALLLTSDFTATGAGIKTLTLRGANAGNNTILGKIVNSSSATAVTKADAGMWILAGANTYSGPTTLNAGVLGFGIANAIANSSSLVLHGGTLNPGGFNQNLAATTLGLTGAATIDFGAGGSELDFANSSLLTWTGGLNLDNWDPLIDKLRIGTDGTGLTAGQLALIEFNGAGSGTAQLDPSGYIVVVPEPSSVLLGLLAASGILWRLRRNAA